MTGPYAHDPAKVSAPTNPAALTPPTDTSDDTPGISAEGAAAPAPGPDTADPAETRSDASQSDAHEPESAGQTTSTPDPADAAGSTQDTAPQEAAPQDSPAPDTKRPEQVTIRQGGFWSMLFGGAIAASIGVVASPYILSSDVLEGRLQAFLSPQQEDTADQVEAQLSAQQEQLDEVQTRLDDLAGDIRSAMDRPAPPPDLSDEVSSLSETLNGIDGRIGDITGRISDVEAQLSDVVGQVGDIEGRIGTLGNRLTAVENRAVPTSDDSEVSSSEIEDLRARVEAQRADMEAQRDAIEAQRSQIESQLSNIETQRSDMSAQGDEIAALRDTLETQADEIAALRDAAEAEEAAARDSARATLQQAALSRVMTAIDTGSPFPDALADLRETGVEVPTALADTAETGVPTRPDLIESFPDAARAALSNVRDTTDGLGAVEIGDFFREQLGMRSLVPREGNDPDAILSRAEAALRDARIGDALTEIETLPEEARTALDDWVARAEQRQEALSAADALADTLN
ncbi:COG4223 family protein [Roseovarius tibetensis]|uniref:COG4223 family protein n=1 Tax=Roseovarius tibetensis TaxID=2685897 RepID=UPI003D7FB512